MTSWISVEERLPEPDEIIWGVSNGMAWVFQWDNENAHFLEYTDKRGGRWEFTNYSNKVTLWQPLPAPPEA